MNILIVYAYFKKSGLCHHFFEMTQKIAQNAGHQVRIRDLYQMNFNPVLDSRQLKQMKEEFNTDPDVQVEQEHIRWADQLIFIYPIWWWERPAILKGWFDRVFTHGFAFNFNEEGLQGLLQGKSALVIQTGGNTKHHYQTTDGELTIHSTIAEGTLEFCGIKDVHIHSSYDLHRAKSELIQKQIQEAEKFLTEHLIR